MQTKEVAQIVEEMFPNLNIQDVLSFSMGKCVFNVTRKADQFPYILKLYQLQGDQSSTQTLAKLIRTLKVLSQQNSSYILKSYELSFDSKMKYLGIILELQKCSLKTVRGKLSETDFWKLLNDITTALRLYNRSEMVYNTIKPSSIFQNQNGQYLLGEPDIQFILNRVVNIDDAGYLSIELLNNQACGPKSQIWSLGVVLYEIMTEQLPYKVKDIPSLRKAIKSELTKYNLIKIVNNDYSKQLNILCVAMLCVNEGLRPSLKQVKNFILQTLNGREPDANILFEKHQKNICTDNYSQKLMQFMGLQVSYPVETQEIRNQLTNPYNSMSTLFFRPSNIKSQLPLLKKKPEIHINTKFNQIETADEYQIQPFIGGMPQFNQRLYYAKKTYFQKSNKQQQSDTRIKQTQREHHSQQNIFHRFTESGILETPEIEELSQGQTQMSVQAKTDRGMQSTSNQDMQMQLYPFAKTVSMNRMLMTKFNIATLDELRNKQQYLLKNVNPKAKELFLHTIVKKYQERSTEKKLFDI